MTVTMTVGMVADPFHVRLAAWDAGRCIAQGSFPATPLGWVAARVFLVDLRRPLRVTVVGTAGLGLRLALEMGRAGNCTAVTLLASTARLVQEPPMTGIGPVQLPPKWPGYPGAPTVRNDR